MTSGGTSAQHVRGEHTTAPAETHTLNIRAPRVSKRVDEALRRLHAADQNTTWSGFRRAALNNDRWVRRYEARRTQRSRKNHVKAHFNIQRQIKVVCGIEEKKREKIHFGFPNIYGVSLSKIKRRSKTVKYTKSVSTVMQQICGTLPSDGKHKVMGLTVLKVMN